MKTLGATCERRGWSVAVILGSSYFSYQHPQYPKDCMDVFNQCSGLNASGVYVIKPDGYPEPFEVYCDNERDGGGWTVIQRREDGSVDFDRQWKEYKDGFGFLSSEFWIGSEKLAFLTNQKIYQLRLDVEGSNGNFFLAYDVFRIGDEWSNYELDSVGEYSGTAVGVSASCPIPTEDGPLCGYFFCSDDSNCNEGQLCCPNGCPVGIQCMESVFVSVKAGNCPVVPDVDPAICTFLCQEDSDCSGFMKCCYTGCGTSCMEPT